METNLAISWRQSARNLRSARVLAVAGMLSGLRIVLESFLFIPLPFLGPNLEFTLTFLPNALGGMYYGLPWRSSQALSRIC